MNMTGIEAVLNDGSVWWLWLEDDAGRPLMRSQCRSGDDRRLTPYETWKIWPEGVQALKRGRDDP